MENTSAVRMDELLHLQQEWTREYYAEWYIGHMEKDKHWVTDFLHVPTSVESNESKVMNNQKKKKLS